jgi:hypothetical protein
MKRRRRAKRNPQSGYTAKQIGWTIAITALTAATGAVVIWYVNRRLEPPPKKPALVVSGDWADAATKAAQDFQTVFAPQTGTV